MPLLGHRIIIATRLSYVKAAFADFPRTFISRGLAAAVCGFLGEVVGALTPSRGF